MAFSGWFGMNEEPMIPVQDKRYPTMRVKEFQYQNVNPRTGEVPTGGSVKTYGAVLIGPPENGRFWVTVLSPIDSRYRVRGTKASFETQRERDKFIKDHHIRVTERR